MTNTKKLNLSMFILTMFIFYIPIFLLVAYSFNTGKSTTLEGLSFKWYAELFSSKSTRLWDAAKMSFIMGTGSALLSTILGGIAAWAIWKNNKKLRTTILSIAYLPLMLPDLIIGISLLTLFVMMTIPLGIGSIFIAHTTMTIPFALLMILGVFEDSDFALIEVAKDLGASEWQIWTKVIIPMISPGLIASFLLTMTLSLDDFAITFFVAGPGATTLPLYVYSSIRFGMSPAINALSTFIIGGSVIIFALNKKHLKTLFR